MPTVQIACVLLLILNVTSHVQVVYGFGAFTIKSLHPLGWRLTAGKHEKHTGRSGPLNLPLPPPKSILPSKTRYLSQRAAASQDATEHTDEFELNENNNDDKSNNSNNNNNNGIQKLALLTSGGDCPSLNACIRAIVKSAKRRGIEVYGLPNGLPGLLHEPQECGSDGENDGDGASINIDHYKIVKLDDDDSFVSTSMLTKGGCRLGGFVSADFKIFDKLSLDERAHRIGRALDILGIQGIIATGGDSSLDRISVLLQRMKDANRKEEEEDEDEDEGGLLVRFVGIPKTIDNDIPSTIFSLGFQSAVSTASQAIMSARDTAESHRRIIVVECMGRDAGFLTLHAGLAGGADAILIPEFPLNDGEDLTQFLSHVKRVYDKDQCAVLAVAESVTLPQVQKMDTDTDTDTEETDLDRRSRAYRQTPDGSKRFGGSAEAVASFLAKSLNVDARHIALGHLQRGGF